MADSSLAKFRVAPLVVYRLGEELITDDIQALLELIKNAYDADASYAQVRIDTGALEDGREAQAGSIEIADDGFGMDRDTVISSWLLIARSSKKRFKEAGKQTPKRRTPLGDKGLGRLGTQRLGWELEIGTKVAKASKEIVVSFSWEDFFKADSLDEIDVQIRERPTKRKHGTVLTIRGLRNPEQWRGNGLTALQRELSQVISPYEGVSGFDVAVTVDGAPLDLQTLNREVRNTAQLHYDINFDGESISQHGAARISFFRPNSAEERRRFEELVEADDGKRFLSHLSEARGTMDLGLERSKGRWFISFTRTRKLEDIGPALDGDGKPANPGPFRAEIDSFDLGTGSDERLEVFGTLQPYRDFIKQLSGVRIYRDGFRVNVEADWLNLGGQWTSARSYYGLKPDTTTGYVAITSRDNRDLIEKTDREGFTDTPHYRTFALLMQDFLAFTGEVQGKLRREYTEFSRLSRASDADVGPTELPEEVASELSDVLGRAGEIRRVASTAMGGAESALASSKKQAQKAAKAGTSDQQLQLTAGATAVLQEAIEATSGALAKMQEYLEAVEGAEKKAKLLREEIGLLREQLAQGVEAMGLGLTAEALSHEMYTIADAVAARSQAIHASLAEGGVSDKELRSFLEHVRGSTIALRRELGHFAPSLRYVRERREGIDVATFTTDLADYYRSRWDKRSINATVKDEGSGQFRVRTSRGKLTQVFDNLFLNSEYWIDRAQQNGDLQQGQVTVTLRRPFVRVFDNGPGVEPATEETLFEPFVTRKPRGVGRGLGLFVVRQLLESEGCAIELSNARNGSGRRYRFDIDLSGALDG